MPAIEGVPTVERPLAMPAGTLGRILLRRWAMILAAGAIGLCVGLLASGAAPAPYQASAYQLVTARGAATTPATSTPAPVDPGPGLAGTQLAITRALAYPEFIHTERVLLAIQREAAPAMGLAQIADRVGATNPPGTALVRVTARASTPAQAQAMADAAAAGLAAYANAAEAATGRAEVTLSTVGGAGLPTSPTEPRTLIWGALGLIGGLAFALALLLARETLRHARRPDRVTGARRP